MIVTKISGRLSPKYWFLDTFSLSEMPLISQFSKKLGKSCLRSGLFPNDAGENPNPFSHNLYLQIVDFVLIRENTAQWKPVFSHILCSAETRVNFNTDSLESFHRLPSQSNHKIIVKCSRKKDEESVLRNRKKLKSFDPRSIGIDSVSVYVNESLCQYCKFLWSKCKSVWLNHSGSVMVSWK